MLLLVLLVAAWLRLGWPGVPALGDDEARLSRMALEMAREWHLATVGAPTSAGVPGFPGAVWLYALPHAVADDPQLALWFTAAANVLAVAGVWWLVRQAWGLWPAIISAALCATSPYLVFYSRGMQEQAWLVPGAVLWAVCVVKAVREKDDRWIAGAAFLAGFLGQVHLAGFALVLPMLWAMIHFRLWRQWRGLALGAGLAVGCAVPLLFHLLQNPEVRRSYLRVVSQNSTLTWTSLRQSWQLGISSGWERFWLGPEWRWSEPLRTPLEWVPRVLAAAILSGALSLAALSMRGKGRRTASRPSGGAALRDTLLPWAAAAPLLFLWSWTPASVHYQLTALPAFLLTAGAAVRSGRRPVIRAVLRVILLAVAIVQAVAVSSALGAMQREPLSGVPGTSPCDAVDAASQLLRGDRSGLSETAGAGPAADGDTVVCDILRIRERQGGELWPGIN